MDASSTATSNSDPLGRSVLDLRGVGPERSALLARLGLRTIRDLIWHAPRRYEDRRHVLAIAELGLDQATTVRGRIVAQGTKRFAQGRKSVFEFILDDGSARLHCRWWNLPYMQNYFKQGDEVLVFGKPNNLKPRTMDHPETEVIDDSSESSIHLNRVAPIYPLTEGLPQRWLRALIWRTLDEFSSLVAEPWAPALTSDLPSRVDALRALHFPDEQTDTQRARQRLAFEELVELQAAIQSRRRALFEKAEARVCAGDNRLIKPFLAQLGFSLTHAQIQVLREMRADMNRGHPMRRLLQGDVGSGKTVVAACCALLALESGYPVALMAPTEILAEQHYRSFTRWLEGFGIPVHLHTGSRKTMRPKKKKGADTADELPLPGSGGSSTGAPETGGGATSQAAARPGIVIGTHALIEDSFALENLGLVIIDEQHRFGVAQREKLVRKGVYPHLLVMTATPIPRTLGLTLYGDLDISTMHELPSGRAAIKTFIRTEESLPKVWAFVKSKLTEGRQAFVVLPRVEETGAGVKAVLNEFKTMEQALAPFRTGLLHGRMKAVEKEATMRAFRLNEVQVLLSTSLVEVGIDVPNATIMLIQNAEQFGLSQLHQLRGRIGRGAHESYCILVAASKTDEAQERLQILADTSDGFQIAEADLKLRGPGDLLGEQQSGLPPLRFANLATDLPLVQRARAFAAERLA